MLIGAVNKFSLIDFPGKAACVLFTNGCNFRCSYCHNKEFVLSELVKKSFKYNIPEEIFFNFLKSRIGLLDGVSICGGEPTIQKDLFNFCKKIKDLGFEVKLDTNGSNPYIIKKLLDNKLIDYIAMDIKNSFDKNYDNLIGIKFISKLYSESIDLIKNSNINYEFRTTLIHGIHSEDSIKSIGINIYGAKKYFLQNFRPGDTLLYNFSGASFSKEKLEKFQKIASMYVQNVFIRY